VGLLSPAGLQIERDLRIRPDPRQLAAQARLFRVLQDRLARLRVVDPFRMGEDLRDGAELFDQPLRPLRPDAGDAGNVVGGIAHQAEDLHHLLRPDAEPLLDGSDVVRLVLHRVDHQDLRGNELHHVLVPGNDDHRHPRLRLPSGDRADDVIRLEALLLDDGDRESPDDLLDIRDLGNQRFGGRPACRLVLFEGLVPEGRPLDVEGHGDIVGLLVAQQLHQHRREAVDRVRGKPFGVGELPDRVEGPEQVVAPVHQHQLGTFLIFGHHQSSIHTGDMWGSLPQGGGICPDHTSKWALILKVRVARRLRMSSTPVSRLIPANAAASSSSPGVMSVNQTLYSSSRR